MKKNNKTLSLTILAILIIVVIGVILFVNFDYSKDDGKGDGDDNNQKCGIQECHGLELTCGENIPEVCTAVYFSGDFCRKYARCEVINGNCQLIKENKFEECKQCFKDCALSNNANLMCEDFCRVKLG